MWLYRRWAQICNLKRVFGFVKRILSMVFGSMFFFLISKTTLGTEK